MAFDSWASNLVSNDTNNTQDVFVHDRQTGQTSRVSLSSDGTEGNNWSKTPAISADGRYVAFYSWAGNLASNDTNNTLDVFVHDRQTGQTSRVSVASNGTQGNGPSYLGAFSTDGRYVAFFSDASNLVSGDTNGFSDVFVHDRQTGKTKRISVASNGTQGNNHSFSSSISADGRYVAYASWANNLVSGDINGFADVFVHDRQTEQTTRVSIASNGAQGNNDSYWPSISTDGRYVTYGSLATNLVSGEIYSYWDVFLHDQQTGETIRISIASNGVQGNNDSYWPSISADNRYITFYSNANNLVENDTGGYADVFIHDRQTGQTSRVSISFNGIQGNSNSYGSSISADGRYIAFYSLASNLVNVDTNGYSDVFVHDRGE